MSLNEEEMSNESTPNSRIPGVSITILLFGNKNISLFVVVCFPLSLCVTKEVLIKSFFNNLLISVDFPTPEEPTKEAVREGFKKI